MNTKGYIVLDNYGSIIGVTGTYKDALEIRNKNIHEETEQDYDHNIIVFDNDGKTALPIHVIAQSLSVAHFISNNKTGRWFCIGKNASIATGLKQGTMVEVIAPYVVKIEGREIQSAYDVFGLYLERFLDSMFE